MQTLKSMSLALFILLAVSLGSFAGEIRKGATMQVKPIQYGSRTPPS